MKEKDTKTDLPKSAVCISDRLKGRHPTFFARLRAVLHDGRVELIQLLGTRDVWVRDFMTIRRHDGIFVSYTYSPDYLRHGYRKLITDWKLVEPFSSRERVIDSGLVLDGGNVVLHGRSAIVTQKIYTENPQLTQAQVQRRLAEAFELDRLIVIPVEAGDIFGHSDGMVAWVGPDHVLLNDYRKIDRKFHRQIQSILRNAGVEVSEVPYAPSLQKSAIPSAVGNYINLLALDRTILLPTFRITTDGEAIKRVASAFSGRTLRSIDASEIACDGGGIRCLTWEFSG